MRSDTRIIEGRAPAAPITLANLPDRLRLQDLARLLRIHKATAARGIAAGTLPGVKVGPRTYVITRGMVEAWQARQAGTREEPQP